MVGHIALVMLDQSSRYLATRGLEAKHSETLHAEQAGLCCTLRRFRVWRSFRGMYQAVARCVCGDDIIGVMRVGQSFPFQSCQILNSIYPSN